jgi:hypothetical protein
MKKRCPWYPVCPMKRFYEEGRIEEKLILEYCLGDNSKCIRKKLEEAGEFHADNMLPNGELRADLK